MSEPVRIAKLIAARGLASRREAETWISAGRVKINGEVVSAPGTMVDPDVDEVRVDGRGLPAAPELVYLLLYKPKGTITSRDDPEGRKSVLELIDIRVRVEPVGRLDYDTEGALLLTNDGELAHRLTHPSTKVPKRYMAKVYRTPDARDLKAIRAGRVQLEDGPAGAAKVRVVDTTDTENAWVEITVTEGRNRLIRRLFAQLGHPVSKLRRESFATLSIRGMERGDVRVLSVKEVARLYDLAAGVRPQKAGRTRYKKGFARPKPKKKRHGHHKKSGKRGGRA